MTYNTYANYVPWNRAGDQWLSQSSTHFEVHYLSKHQEIATRVLQIAEQIHSDLLPFFKTEFARRTHISLVDSTDFSNGWATPIFFAQIRLLMHPPDGIKNGLYSLDDWLHGLIKHEYTHILHLELSTGLAKGAQYIFGRIPLAFPFIFVPSFVKEGLAVYQETDFKRKYGRLQSDYYMMQMRMEVLRGLYSLGQISAHTRKWPYSAAYLYGAFFYDVVMKKYGPSRMQEFMEGYSSRLIPMYGLNAYMSDAYDGRDFNDLWDEFEQAMKDRFLPQIKRLQAREVTGEQIGKGNSFQVMATSPQGLMRVSHDGASPSYLQLYDGKEKEWVNLFEAPHATSLAVQTRDKLALTRQINRFDGTSYQDVFVGDEQAVSMRTVKQRFLQVHWRGNQNQLIARRIVGLRSQLWQLNPDTNEQEQIWQSELNCVVGHFSLAPSGRYLIASVKRPRQGWNLERFNFTSGKWSKVTETRATENTPHVLEGNRVVYSANYDGIFNIYVLNLSSGQVKQWTREVGGAFSPVWQPELGLVYQTYEVDGMAVKNMPRPETLRQFSIRSRTQKFNYPNPVNKKAQVSEPKPYSPWSTLRPYSLLPYVKFNVNNQRVGVNLRGHDVLHRNSYDLIFSEDIKLKKPFLSGLYLYDNRWIIASSYSYQDTIYEGVHSSTTALLQRSHLFTFWEDQISTFLGGSLEFLSSEEVERRAGVAMQLTTEERVRNVPGVAWGTHIDLIAEYYNYKYYDKVYVQLFNGKISLFSKSENKYYGYRLQAGLRHTFLLPWRFTMTLDTHAGYDTEKENKYAFEIGYDALPSDFILFERKAVRLRGYENNIQKGSRYASGTASMRHLLARIEWGYSVYPIGISDIYVTGFYDIASAWRPSSKQKWLDSVGAELTIELATGGAILPISLSYAQGLDPDFGLSAFSLAFVLPI
tara:strand:- start:8451 stop:11225 length:2775 start_codon:yes stop_codon:yes gene_type:complete